MMKCSSCGKETGLSQNGEPLCIDCLTKMQEIRRNQIHECDRQLNHLGSLMEAFLRLPQGSVFPRFSVPEPLIQGDNMVFNNISVNRSTIGAINTGSIAQLDIAISRVKASNQAELSEALGKLANAILESDLPDEQKEEAVEDLSFLGEEAAKDPSEKRKTLSMKVFSSLGILLSNANNLKTLWELVAPMLQSVL